VCQDGQEAKKATQIVIDRDVKGSVLFFDHEMHPVHKGLKLFREYHDNLPEGTTRILYSGNLPRDHQKYIKRGIIDGAIPKYASDFDKLPEQIADACLNRNIRTVFGNRPR
jgi:hypothetical protein